MTAAHTHEYFMGIALAEAEEAAALGEVPVGAVLVEDGRVVSKAGNRREQLADPTAHAEVLAIREAARIRGHWRVDKMIMYVTLEPCPMCAGAMVLARIDSLVYGASDPKSGAAGSLMNIAADDRLNHRLHVMKGVMAQESSRLLKQFFGRLRQ